MPGRREEEAKDVHGYLRLALYRRLCIILALLPASHEGLDIGVYACLPFLDH